MEALVMRFGLWAVFFGAAVEGDVALVLAGVAVHLGLLPFPESVAVGAAGSLTGDCFWYWLGRWHAPALRATRFYQRSGPTIERWADHIGAVQILMARFVWGTRIASMSFWGLRGMPLWRFAAVDALGCAAWSFFLASMGLMVSGNAERLIGQVRRVELWLLGALLFSAAVFSLIQVETARRRRRRTGEDREPTRP